MKNFTLIEKLKSTFGKEKLVRALIVSLVAPLLTVIIAPAQLAPTANAAAVLTSGPLSIESVSWNIVGLDSNNVNVGPNLFPFGAKVCNTSGSPVSNVSMSWTWGVGDATALNIRGSSNLPISDTGTATTLTLGVGANSCTYAFWSVEVTRASASYDKTRKYNISATDGTNTVNTDPDVAIKVEKLVSQARNDVQTLSISNGIPAVGDTATVTMTGATSTSYEQLTAWPVFDLSFAQIVSMNFTFTNDGTTRFNSPISQVYADACGWNQLTNACAGSGKAGGSVTVTMVIKRIAAGALNMNGVIYDFSGSSFHYNSDYGTDGLLDSTQIDSAVAANVANDDSFFTPLNTTLTSATVATNDSENVTPVTYTKLTNPTNGSISSFSTAGVFTYVPTTDFSGFDSFTYKLCKSDDNACDTATVNIVVGIQAVNDSVSVDYQGSLTSEPLNSNDYYNSYTLGTNIFYDTSTAVTSGAITSFNGSTGTFNYTAANGLSGPATFTYIICLTSCISPVETSTATVTINVGPRAVNESYSTTGTAPVTGNVSTNDIYPTSKTFRLNSTTNANGTVSLNTSTGAFTYTANGGFSGTATFTYDVCDSFGTCSTATVTITVAAPIVLITPDITWPTPAPIYYPTPLSSVQLNAVAKYNGLEVPGSYVYQYTSGTVLNPGSVALNVTFYPTDSGRYAQTTASVIQLVLTGISVLTWPTPTPKTGPYTLDPSVLNATCSVLGTFSYEPVLGTVLQPGTYTLKVTCTPTDPKIAPVSKTVTLVVNPTLTWVDPTEKTGPYTVDASILNAVCNTPGTLTYDPALGSVLQPGTYTLKVTCTPTDPTLKPLTTTVTLKVNQTLTWVDPSEKTGPYTLDASVLNAKCNTTSTLTYDPALGAVRQPGTYTLKVTCTPTDPTLKPLTTTVALKVNPTLTWVDPTEKTGPYTLDASVLNAVCNTPGTLTYDPALGAVLQPGTYTLKVTCTPTDPTLKPLTTTVTLKVNPTLTWVDPTEKTGPYTVDASILNAVCNTPGTLTYDPALGAVLQPGTYTLKVTCTPTDPTLKPITTTVPFKVVKPTVIDVQPLTIPGNLTTVVAVPIAIKALSPVVESVCAGLTGAVLASGQISYTPGAGFSGNTCVNVKVLIDGVLQNVRIPVVVSPVAPNAFKEPVTFYKGLITWSASPNATGYQVKIRGKLICTTIVAQLSCNAPQTVGPATPVLVTALGNDNTSTTVEAKYIPRRVLAFIVYFDIAKFALTKTAQSELTKVAKIMKEEGFVNLELAGHTDSSPFDNVTLAKNRSKSTYNFLKKRLPTLNPSINSYSDANPAAKNSSAANKAKNRRTEGYVY